MADGLHRSGGFLPQLYVHRAEDMRRCLFAHIKKGSVDPEPIRNIANPVFDIPPTACFATICRPPPRKLPLSHTFVFVSVKHAEVF